MASGRNQVDYTDIDYDALTLKIDNSTITFDATQPGGAAATMIGKAVTLSAADTVALCADGEFVLGKLLKVTDDLFCTVQHEGFCTLPGGASASLTLGKAIVGALGAASAKGYIREVATATAAELGRMNGRIINAAVTTDVVVEFD